MNGDTKLRRSWLRGYRQGDVELAVARATLLQEQLQHELEATKARANAMQTEITELHRRVETYRQRETEMANSLDEMRGRAISYEPVDLGPGIVAFRRGNALVAAAVDPHAEVSLDGDVLGVPGLGLAV